MDKNRRKFLKIILIGSGALIAGKILGPLFSEFLDGLPAQTNLIPLPPPEKKKKNVDALVKAEPTPQALQTVENKKVYVDSLVKTNYNPGVFRIVQHKKVLSIYDHGGEEIFQIDTSA